MNGYSVFRLLLPATLVLCVQAVQAEPNSPWIKGPTNNPYTVCKGKGTNYLYIVPTRQTGIPTLEHCNVGGGLGYPTLSAARRYACGRMAKGENPQLWPQTWNSPVDFGIAIRCR
jgi:hypothetical protein